MQGTDDKCEGVTDGKQEEEKEHGKQDEEKSLPKKQKDKPKVAKTRKATKVVAPKAKAKAVSSRARKPLFSASLGRLALCLGTNKSELCGMKGKPSVFILTCKAKQSKWHRELVESLAHFAATHDVSVEELRKMKEMKLQDMGCKRLKA